MLAENPRLARVRPMGAEALEPAARGDATVRDCLLVQALLSHHEATATRLEQRIAYEPDAALGHALSRRLLERVYLRLARLRLQSLNVYD